MQEATRLMKFSFLQAYNYTYSQNHIKAKKIK